MGIREQYEDLCMEQVRLNRKIAKLQGLCGQEGSDQKSTCPYFGPESDWSESTCPKCGKHWLQERSA